MIVNRTDELFTLCGDFEMPVGEVERLEDGYRYVGDGYEMTATVTGHPTGVMRRRDRIKNISDCDISIRTALSRFVFHGGEYEVYTQYSEWCNESMGAWQPLVTEIGAANDDIRMNCGANPFVALWNVQSGRGTAFHILADSTWRFRVKKHFHQSKPKQKAVIVELGINDRNFDYCLHAGETLELPEIVYYEFRNKTDMDAYKLHRWCNEVYPARSMPVIYNSWMSRGDDISYDILSEQLTVAKELGAEYFVIDAGWFGAPKQWFESVGDWEECTEFSMCGRMKEFADRVRAEGLRFGLWFEIERAAVTARTVKQHPEHYLIEGGNAFLDFSSEAACEYLFEILSAQIGKYGIEFIKFDFNAPITFDRHRHAFLDYFSGYRKFIDRLHQAFPTLYFENCASGGLRMALANLRGFDSFWMSDNHSLYAQLDIFKHTMLRMPCRALERWITIQSLDRIKGRSHEKILVSGDAGWKHVEAVFEGFLKAATVGGPIGISCDVTAFSPDLKQILKEHITQYKSERDFWMHAECHILTDTPTMLVLQFCDARYDEVKIFAYTQNCNQLDVTVYPICDAGASYQDADGQVYGGDALGHAGVEVCFDSTKLYDGYALSFKKVGKEGKK